MGDIGKFIKVYFREYIYWNLLNIRTRIVTFAIRAMTQQNIYYWLWQGQGTCFDITGEGGDGKGCFILRYLKLPWLHVCHLSATIHLQVCFMVWTQWYHQFRSVCLGIEYCVECRLKSADCHTCDNNKIFYSLWLAGKVYARENRSRTNFRPQIAGYFTFQG